MTDPFDLGRVLATIDALKAELANERAFHDASQIALSQALESLAAVTKERDALLAEKRAFQDSNKYERE